MEKEVVHKALYKIEIILLKYIPLVILLFNIINTITSYFGYDFNSISYLTGIGFIPLLFFYVSSRVFRFCEYHRIPIYFVTIINLLNCIDYEYGIPISDRYLFLLNCCLSGISILLIIILKFRICK